MRGRSEYLCFMSNIGDASRGIQERSNDKLGVYDCNMVDEKNSNSPLADARIRVLAASVYSFLGITRESEWDSSSNVQ